MIACEVDGDFRMDEKWKNVWNELVDDYRENRNSDEATVQKSWEELLGDPGIFGYSKRNREVRSQLPARIGSKDRVIPDIVVEKSGEKRFVVELKRYSSPFDKNFESQLFSYLTNVDIHCPIGVLVCEKIFVYLYDFNSNSYKSIGIPFERDSSNGIAFVELFSNGGFDFEKIKAFVEREVQRSEELETIRSELKKPEVVERAVREYFERKNFSKDVVAQVLGEFRFDCREKANDFVASSGNVSYKVTDSPVKNPGTNQSKNSGGIGKSFAKSMAQSKGFRITKDYSYAHNTGKFWSNPAPELLEKDWWIILDDDSEKKLYVFFVPKHSLETNRVDGVHEPGKLYRRNDSKGKNRIDLHILPGDFCDTASGISFKRFLKGSIDY